jgi:hypothetical protein
MDTPDLDRLTILERAQQLHDATLRRHGEMLDRHADDMAALARLGEQQRQLNDQLIALSTRLNQEQALHAAAQGLHHERLARYDAILTRLDEESARHAERLARLDQILQAIKDMLDRGNGH